MNRTDLNTLLLVIITVLVVLIFLGVGVTAGKTW